MAKDTSQRLEQILSATIHQQLFPPHRELLPEVNEVYELSLAFYESQILSDSDLIRNGAYFMRVGDMLTRHFAMCSGQPVRLPQHSSSRLKSFFQTKQFKTGYGTHGLFPYRGKFHPQMIKGLLNTMGLKPGETVLDPMMGSGTVLIEAALMGINSVGIDASPFCRFMAQAKLDGLMLPLAPVRAALDESKPVFDYFQALAGPPSRKQPKAKPVTEDLFATLEAASPKRKLRVPSCCDDPKAREFLLLAFLDSAGYSERSSRAAPFEQFHAILERYLFVTEKIQRVLEGAEHELGQAKPMSGDARQLSLPDASVDGIVFSPPYSFAIDYLDNDAFHLRFMNVDTAELRKSMVGLRGDSLSEKYDLYKADMSQVLSECARVLRPGRICTIVVGTNNNQLGKILGVPADEVQGIDDLLTEAGRKHGLTLLRRLERQITGMANTMRTEFIVMLQRT